MQAGTFNINTGDGLISYLKHVGKQFFLNDIPRTPSVSHASPSYCSKCTGIRKHYIFLRSTTREGHKVNYAADVIGQFTPAVFCFQCQECESKSYAMLLNIKDQPHLFVVPEANGGFRTEHTPDAVAFYLDQAKRSEFSEARSAAAAMYRAAIEHLLHEQGFRENTLNLKVLALEKAIQNGTGPSWLKDIDHELFILLKNIGNGSIHTNGGDITVQRTIDVELLRTIEIVILTLLDAVYEAPIRKASKKAQLAQAADLLKH